MPKSTKNQPGLVIVGAGAAGLAAAAAAAETYEGAITLVEKRTAPGGNAAFVMGMFAAGSRLQAGMGIDADVDRLFKKAMAYAHWRTNPRLVRTLIARSGETVGWLEKHGLDIDRIHPMYPNQTPMVFHFHKAPGKMGARYVKAFSSWCEKKGVRIITRAGARQLLRNEAGKLEGVIAGTKNGDICLSARAVILTTGGFLGNQALIQSYLPSFHSEELHLIGLPHTGDGIQMATAVGAASDGLAVLEMNGPTFPGSNCLSVLVHHPKTLWVNAAGERFTDESLVLFPETANCLYRQPGRISYTLFDQCAKERIVSEGIAPLDAMMIGKRDLGAALDADLEKYRGRHMTCIADSPAGIAEFIGIEARRLEQQIDAYNQACDSGYDILFAKDRRHLAALRTPPFYAIRAGLKVMATHGGIKINEHMQVIDTQGLAIPGLFAAGVETGSSDAGSYDGHLTGHSFGFSVVSGRIAGENAAAFIKKEKPS